MNEVQTIEQFKPNLLTGGKFYKPMHYPWAHAAWLQQQQIAWLPEEVSLADDVRDWHSKLTPSEKHLLTQIFRFFTQADIEVNNCYVTHYMSIFKPTEVRMMLVSFANMETIHIHAYAFLLDTIGMPEIEYQAFLQFKEMKDKYEYANSFNVDNKQNIAKTLAAFGAFTEGLQLFASFAMLMNFQRFKKMKGMGQIVTWSARDETLHTVSIIQLYHTFLSENPDIDVEALHRELYEVCQKIVEHEDAFIDLAFQMEGGVEGMTAEDIKGYIRYIANRRLKQLGMSELYTIEENPLPWMDTLLNAPEHTNFFENVSTEYSRAATTGTWEEAFEGIDRFKEIGGLKKDSLLLPS